MHHRRWGRAVELIKISWRDHRIPRQLRISKGSQTRGIELLSKVEAKLRERMCRQGSSWRDLHTARRPVRVVRMASWANFFVFPPFRSAVLKPNLEVRKQRKIKFYFLFQMVKTIRRKKIFFDYWVSFAVDNNLFQLSFYTKWRPHHQIQSQHVIRAWGNKPFGHKNESRICVCHKRLLSLSSGKRQRHFVVRCFSPFF